VLWVLDPIDGTVNFTRDSPLCAISLALVEDGQPVRALRIRVHDSEAVDLAWLAAGRLDAALMLSNLPSDVGGGILLVREAGGVVYDAEKEPHTPARSTPSPRPRRSSNLWSESFATRSPRLGRGRG
jgi:fructose-1,6-bisphosphatase/inositol monophosphatase family enzyme